MVNGGDIICEIITANGAWALVLNVGLKFVIYGLFGSVGIIIGGGSTIYKYPVKDPV